jgi:hypothetical protein
MSRDRVPGGRIAAVSTHPIGLARGPTVAVATALLYCVACLAMIAWGAQFAGASAWLLSGSAVVFLISVRFLARALWADLVFWPMGAVLLAYVASIACSGMAPQATARSLSTPVFAVLFLAVQACRRADWAWKGLWVSIVFMVLVISIDVVVQRWTGDSLIRGKGLFRKRWMGSQGNANDLVCAAVLAPVAFALFRPPWRGVKYGAWMVLLIPIWLVSESRQVLLAWFVATVVPLACHVGKRRALVIVLAATLIGSTAVLFAPLLRYKLSLALEEGIGVREQLIALGIRFGLSHPVFGIGPGCFGEHFLVALGEGWTWRGKSLPPAGTPWVHCLPVEIFCEYGLFGVAAFGLVLRDGVRRLSVGVRQPEPERAPWICLLACSFAVACVSCIDLSLVKDWVRIEFWLILGLFYALGWEAGRIESRRKFTSRI